MTEAELRRYQDILARNPKDAFGAIEAWETLLSSNPTYQEADKVRRMVTEAKSKVVPLMPRRTGR